MADSKPESRRGRSTIKTVLYCVFGVVFIAGALIAACYFTPLSYLYCLSREESWKTAKTETELDGRMWAFYSKKTITPANSMWGKDYQLKPGERVTQYLIFGKEPLDVVFDSQSRVVMVFTSYE